MESEREALEMRVHEVDDKNRRARLSHTQQGICFAPAVLFRAHIKKLAGCFSNKGVYNKMRAYAHIHTHVRTLAHVTVVSKYLLLLFFLRYIH